MKRWWLIVGIVIALVLIAIGTYVEFSNKNNSPVSNFTNSLSTDNEAHESYWKTYNVSIKGFAYIPFLLKIKEGEKVVWTNYDSLAHTVTSDVANQFSSGTIMTGKSFEYVFEKEGIYDYHCSIYPYIKGKVIVEKRE